MFASYGRVTAASAGAVGTSIGPSAGRSGVQRPGDPSTVLNTEEEPTREGRLDTPDLAGTGRPSPVRSGLRQHGAVIHEFRRRIPTSVVWTPGLNRMAAAQALGGAADALVAVSLAGSLFFNLSPSASRDQVLLYLVINMAPFAILAPFIGPAIDRFGGGHRLIAAGLLALRGAFAAALAFFLFDLTLYFFALALLIAGKASGVTRQALVPGLVARAGPAARGQRPARSHHDARRRRGRRDRGAADGPHLTVGDPRRGVRTVPRRRRRRAPASRSPPRGRTSLPASPTRSSTRRPSWPRRGRSPSSGPPSASS